MTLTQQDTTTATPASGATGIPAKFEVTTPPVADVDRAKAFYERLGWRLDIDFKPTPDTRAVQLTPPGSQASIQFGEGTNTMAPGSLQGLFLVVDDIAAARADLVGRGVDVGDVVDVGGGVRYAALEDPDGNTWTLQEITERLPGRVEKHDSGALAQLLFETARRHGQFEAVAPPHDWWDWYGAYMDARQQGSLPEEAAKVAGRYMAEVKHVVVAAE